MALMMSGDGPQAPPMARPARRVSGASGPMGTGQDGANPSAGPAKADILQASVFGTEYANPKMYGPADPQGDAGAIGTAAHEASENYAGGDRQPQVAPVALGSMGLTSASVPQDLSPTSRGSTTVGNKRRENMMPRSTNLGQALGGAGLAEPRGGNAPLRLGTTLGVAIARGGVRAAGAIALPSHIRGSTATSRGPTA